MKKMASLIGITMALSGGMFPDIKPSAKDKRAFSDRRKSVPPRSMTPDELEYYKKYKTLIGFIQPEYD